MRKEFTVYLFDDMGMGQNLIITGQQVLVYVSISQGSMFDPYPFDDMVDMQKIC